MIILNSFNKKGYISLEYIIVASIVCVFVALMFPWFRREQGDYSNSIRDKLVAREEYIGEHVLAYHPTTTNSIKTDQWVIGGDNSGLITSSVEVSHIDFANGEDYEMRVGDIIYIDATVRPTNATKKDLSWVVISGGNYIIPAKIDSSTIQITGAAPGRSVITANAKDGSGTKKYAYITVIQPVNKIELDHSVVNMSAAAGDVTYVTATVSPFDATEQRVNWAFGNGGIGSECVDMETNGKSIKLTAKRNCNGVSAKIIATTLDGGYTAEVEINVGA